MTIGIGALGPRAGLAIVRALNAAERVAEGSIGGFVTFAAITADGRLFRAQTQRGGTRTLFTLGEKSSGVLPIEIEGSTCAALMSSGPDRPEPLSQFVAGDAAVGLVSGHRLPNGIGRDGVAFNEAVLARMRGGAAAADALEAVLTAEPEADAGMIALGPARGIAALNSNRVAQRPDLGSARMERNGATVEVLHNAITPRAALAPLVAEIAIETMCPRFAPRGQAIVRAGTPLVAAGCHRLVVDPTGEALRIDCAEPTLLRGQHNCAAVHLGAPVVTGSGELLGYTLLEPNAVVRDGSVISLSGSGAFTVPYGSLPEKRG